MLVLEGVRKRYGEAHALSGLDLTVAEGELLCVLGPSGSGKSTALRVVAGLETPDGGRVHIDGEDVTDRPAAERGVAMVFQTFALFPHLSVAGNIGFGLAARRIDARERERRVREAADALEVGALLDRRPAALSGGERQRVALARALAGRPRLLLLDEPLSNLDAPLRERARAEIRKVHAAAGTTTVFVTHDQYEALSLGDRVAVLDRGTLRQVGDPDEVFARPADTFVARFVGSPAMNLVAVEASGGTLRGPSGLALPAPAGTADGSYLAGFRPEDVRVVGPAAGFAARLHTAERAGHDRLWRLRVGDAPFVARVRPGDRAAEGDAVRVTVDASAVRLFDPRSGRAL